MLAGRLENVWRFLGDRAGLPYPAAMTYRFGPFELDLARGELRADGEVRPLEPQVFALLVLLVETASASCPRTRSSRKSGRGASFPTRRSRAA